MRYELSPFNPEFHFYSILPVVCVSHKLEGLLPFADLVLGDGKIGSSGSEDYSATNSGPVSWGVRILMPI